MKKVSLIIPIYNLEHALPACLESVCSQTYKNLEILLIDDGSCDTSAAVCRSFAEEDPRIRYFHHDNHGVSYTRNRGIQEATGELLMFIDGDDWVAPDMVEHYAAAAVETDASVVIGGMTMVHADGRREVKLPPAIGCFGSEIWDAICRDTSGVFGYVPNKMYRTNLLQRGELAFDMTMYAQEDLDFALGVYGVSHSFCLIDCAGYYYRYAPGKRSHPFHHYIRNQLKMLRLAGACPQLGYDSREAVLQRIELLVYVALYEAAPESFGETFCLCFETEGLVELLRERRCVNHRWLMKQFCKKNIVVVKDYLVIRKWISSLIHRNKE